MLSLFQEVITAFTPLKQTRSILLLGIESSGKTSLCSALSALLEHRNRNEDPSTAPALKLPKTTRTLGQNVVELETEEVVVTVWDLGGSEAIRPMWKHYVGDADMLVYVLDGRERIEQVEKAIDILLDIDDVQTYDRSDVDASHGGRRGHESKDGDAPYGVGDETTIREEHFTGFESNAVNDTGAIRPNKPILVLATKMDVYEMNDVTPTAEPPYTLDDGDMAARLEAIATAFSRKLDEKRDQCRTLLDTEYSITCLPVSCLHAPYLEDVLNWMLNSNKLEKK